ncbi:MAG: DNA cytosine methyltransferase [Ignavibacteriales bacterium]|nr:DNA cytosine methyltransferase [Ignavibacteriales bacterium]
MLTFLDLFAGASGLSEGFINSGFIPVAHVEKDLYACQTITTRTAFHYCNQNNLSDLYKKYYYNEISRDILYREIPKVEINKVINEEINYENYENIVKKIQKLKNKLDVKNIDVLIGGPPCQAYSIRGRKANESKKNYDERIYYYRLYAKFLNKLKPKIFIFENVPGLVSFENGFIFDDLKKTLASEGYIIDFKILNAVNFGVLQDRKRIIIIGWKKDLQMDYPIFESSVDYSKVNDLFNDLIFINPGATELLVPYREIANNYLTRINIRNGFNKVQQHISRPHNIRDLEIYKRVIDLWNSKKERLKYNSLPKKLKTHKNVESFLDRFKVIDGEANFSHTLIAHIAKDGHYYIHPDINQCRSISVREAARIQSFPDNFIFEGPRTAAFTQIGNAVPPLMSYKIANKLKEKLNEI